MGVLARLMPLQHRKSERRLRVLIVPVLFKVSAVDALLLMRIPSWS
jgi:hypothetical protein